VPNLLSDKDINIVEGFGDKATTLSTRVKNTFVQMMADALESPMDFLSGKSLDARKRASHGASGSWDGPAGPDDDLPLRIFDQGAGFNDLFRPSPLKAPKGKFLMPGDSLANVGGYVGGAGSGGGGPVDVLKQSLKVQTSTRDYLREFAENKATF
jgi:hypothetical protein